MACLFMVKTSVVLSFTLFLFFLCCLFVVCLLCFAKESCVEAVLLVSGQRHVKSPLSQCDSAW